MSSKFSSKTSRTSPSERTAVAYIPKNGIRETVHQASGDHTLCGKRIGSWNGFWRERKKDSWDHNLECQRCLKHTDEYQESLRLFNGPWKMPVTLMLLAMLIAPAPAPAGGTGGPEPSHIVCLLFDMSSPAGKQWKGWHPVSREAREQISKDVGAGKAEWIEADTLECIERHPMNKNIGKVIRTERLEWWRWKEPKKAARHD